MPDENEFLDAFGLNVTEPETDSEEGEDTADKSTGNPSGVNNANPDAQEPDAGSNPDDNGQEPDPQDHQRMNRAFAQMRVENNNMKQLLNNIAGVLGINPQTAQNGDVQEAIQQAVIKAQAKQQNVDPGLLQRLNDLEAYKNNAERQALSNKAMFGFQAVKNQFNLTDKDLNDFAEQLVAANINPYTQDVDLVSEYKLRNFDKLIEAAVARGVEQEASRQKNVNSHSTTPGSNTGGGNTDADKIHSVAELTKWFNENNK